MKKVLLFTIALLGALRVHAQNVGIGTSTPDATAMLDITATNRGILIPRVALTATNVAAPVTGPANSLLVYNTATAGTAPNNVTPGYYYWNGTQWVRLLTAESSDWKLDGNTNAALRYIGTNDNFDFPIRTNGTEKMRVMAGGNVGIGTAAPAARLDVIGPATGSGITIRAGGGGDVVLAAGGSLFFDNNYSYAAGNYIRPVAANTQTFVTSGAERMRITPTGNIGINTAAPAASAILDIASTNQGIRIPNVALTATNNNAPVGAGVVNSLLVYNTATAGTFPTNVWPGYYYWDGTQWVRVGSDGGDWSIRGNTLTGGTAATPNEVLGSNNAYQLHIRTNGTLRFRVADDQPQLMAEGNGTAGRPSYSWNGDNTSGMYRSGVGSVSFATQGIERLRLTNTPQILSVGNGTVGAPAWSWTGETNTGMYLFGAGTISFTTQGTERLRLTNTPQILSVGNGTAAAPSWSWTSNNNTGIYRAAADQIGISTAGTFRINIGAQNGSFGFNKVPANSRIPGIQFFEIYTPAEIGNDGGANSQITMGYWRWADPELSPEANLYGYVGYIGGSAANPAWWRMYSYGYITASRRELKKNITPVNDDAGLEQWVLNDIKNIKPSFYHYNNEQDNWNAKLTTKYRPHYHLGVIVDESPDYVKDEAFSGIDGYGLASLALAGTKYCINQLEDSPISDFGTVQFHGKQMEVKYSESFVKKLNGNIPVVQITLQDFTDAQLIVTNKTSNGFTILSNKEISHLAIDWTALSKPSSAKTTAMPSNIDVNRLKVPDAIKSNIQNYFFNLKATDKRVEE